MEASSVHRTVFIERETDFVAPSYQEYKQKRSLFNQAVTSLAAALVPGLGLPKEFQIAQRVLYSSAASYISASLLSQVFTNRGLSLFKEASVFAGACSFAWLAYYASKGFSVSMDLCFEEAEHLTDAEQASCLNAALKKAFSKTVIPLCIASFAMGSSAGLDNKHRNALLIFSLATFAIVAHVTYKIFATEVKANVSEKRQQMFEGMHGALGGEITLGPYLDWQGRSKLRAERLRPDPNKIDKDLYELKNEVHWISVCEIGKEENSDIGKAGMVKMWAHQAHMCHLEGYAAQKAKYLELCKSGIQLVRDEKMRVGVEIVIKQAEAAMESDLARRGQLLAERDRLKQLHAGMPSASTEMKTEKNKGD